MKGFRTTAFLVLIASSLLSIARAGTVVVWGDNSFGETNLPPNLTNVTAIAAGGFHSLALNADGTVVGWGDNTLNQSTVPAGLSNVVAIAAGESFSCALQRDGTVVYWGDPELAPLNQVTNVVAITAGGYHALFLRADGTLGGWGETFYDQANPPSGLSNVVAFAAGDYHSIALKSDGTVVTWGDDRNRQCTGAIVTNASAIAAGCYHTMAIKKDGSVICFGDNGCGQTNVPLGLLNPMSIAGGACSSLALKQDGTIAAWGNAVTPTLTNIVAIAAGRVHYVALIGQRSTTLSIRMQNGNANVNWSDASFQLQTTTNLLNPASWQSVGTSTNAYATTPAEKARFFRLIKN